MGLIIATLDSEPLDAASLSTTGEFSVSSPYTWDLSQFYKSGAVKLLAAPRGDFERDNDVDGTKYLKWQWGESPSSLSLNDLAQWQANYGALSISSGESTRVPEPTSLLLIVAGYITFKRRAGNQKS